MIGFALSTKEISFELGESFCDGAQSRHWQDFAFIDLLVCVPDPYWFCFHRGFTWTCTTVVPTELHRNKLNYGPCLGNYQSSMLNNNIAEHTDLRVCRLNGRLDLNLRDHLGPDEMPPKASKCVHIDAKVSNKTRLKIHLKRPPSRISVLHSGIVIAVFMAHYFCCCGKIHQRILLCILQFVSSLQSLAASRILETFPSSTAFEDLSIPKALAEELAVLSKLQSTAVLKNF